LLCCDAHVFIICVLLLLLLLLSPTKHSKCYKTGSQHALQCTLLLRTSRGSAVNTNKQTQHLFASCELLQLPSALLDRFHFQHTFTSQCNANLEFEVAQRQRFKHKVTNHMRHTSSVSAELHNLQHNTFTACFWLAGIAV
jgi:hypothetical protein